MAEFQTGVVRPIDCMKEGWELIKDQYWLILGITTVGMLIGSFIPFGIGIGAMFCGIYYVLLRKMNGQPFEFADLFKGFNYFVPGLIISLVVVIPTLISVFVIYGSVAAFILTAVNSNGTFNEAVIYGMFATLFIEAVVIALITSSLHALIMFAYPLVVDRNLNGIEAFKLSVKAVWANLSGVVGVILVEFVMGLIAAFIPIVGVYLVLPIMFAGVLVSYRRVFPSQQTSNQPPSPVYYQGI
ncbi:MAG: hypothetical protein ABJA66_02645 [Actinomycetota bacterium]